MSNSYSSADAAPRLGQDNSSTPGRFRRHPVVWGLLFLAALLVVWFIVRAFSKPKPKPAGPQPIPVAIAPVTVGNATQSAGYPFDGS